MGGSTVFFFFFTFIFDCTGNQRHTLELKMLCVYLCVSPHRFVVYRVPFAIYELLDNITMIVTFLDIRFYFLICPEWRTLFIYTHIGILVIYARHVFENVMEFLCLYCTSNLGRGICVGGLHNSCIGGASSWLVERGFIGCYNSAIGGRLDVFCASQVVIILIKSKWRPKTTCKNSTF